MPALSVDRPQSWNQVVGQERVVRVLHAMLNHPERMTRGFIFEGPYAVGKTSCGYLFARGLLCQVGGIGCGTCDSCVTAQSLDSHPSFKEVDASMFPSALAARELLERMYGQPTLGNRRVVIVDEAHDLSSVAWDVFLKPLEEDNDEVVFIFITSRGDQIPGPIRSRCSVLRFGKVDLDSLTGMLVTAADTEGIPYKMDGMRLIARYADGRPRDAMKGLSMVSSLGEVTVENVETALNFDATLTAQSIYALLLKGDTVPAIHKADELAQRVGPQKVIETLFTAYMHALFSGSSIPTSFAPLKDMTAFFIKWLAAPNLPADIVPLFIVELHEMRMELYRKPETQRPRTFVPETTRVVDTTLSPRQLMALAEKR